MGGISTERIQSDLLIRRVVEPLEGYEPTGEDAALVMADISLSVLLG